MNKNVKLTWEQLVAIFMLYNSFKNNTEGKFNGDNEKKPLHGVVVFKSSNWPDKNYSLESRSYQCTSNNKVFKDWCIGSSCFCSSLDGTDLHVDIVKYDWEVDYCYLL